MKNQPIVLFSLVALAIALPVRKDSLPFSMVAVVPSEPRIDGRAVTRSPEDGSMWVNSGTNSFLAKVNSNQTLQELGTGEFLSIGPHNELLLGMDTSPTSTKFSIDDQSLEYMGKRNIVGCQKYNDEYQLYWAGNDQEKFETPSA